jgi:hypothetical protein
MPVGDQRERHSLSGHPPMGVGAEREKTGRGEEHIDVYQGRANHRHHGISASEEWEQMLK